MQGTLAAVLANILFWAALNVFGAAAVTSLTPRSVYHYANWLFRERRFERRLYRALRVNRWKDKLPVYGQKAGMLDRRHLAKSIDRAYLDAFIAETCKAELVHVVLAVLGFSSVFLVAAGVEGFPVFLAAAVTMLCLHMPFILAQRYNRRRLLRLRERIKKA